MFLMTKDVLIQSSVKWGMYNARTPPIQFRSRRKKGSSLERFSFPWSTFITFLVNIKRVSYPRLCDCFRGLFVGFKGLQNDWNNILLLHILTSLDCRCRFSQLVTICYFALFLLARITGQTFFELREKRHLVTVVPFHVKFVSVWSCLPLQSPPCLVSATWRKTLYYQVVPQDHSRVLCISATLLRVHLTQGNHFQPTLGRQIDKP